MYETCRDVFARDAGMEKGGLPCRFDEGQELCGETRKTTRDKHLHVVGSAY